MKAIPHNSASFFPRGPGGHTDSYLVKPLLYLLAALLFSAALWHVATLPDEATAARAAPARLELILSGALTDTLSLGKSNLKTMTCGPSGFALETRPGAALSLKLTFEGAPARTSGSRRTLGPDGNLTLRVGGTLYVLMGGSATSTPELRTFNASFADPLGLPLLVNGRLVC